jgi:hypothetical protein
VNRVKVESATMGPRARECVEAAVRAARFEKTRKGGTFRFPYRF